MKSLVFSALAACSLVSTGCAATSGAHSADSGIRLGDSSEEPLRMEGDSITGPKTSLRMGEDGMHGRYLSRNVALQWNYQELTGSVGERPTRLQLAEGDDTRVWGTFAGMAMNLTEDGTWLQGLVGGCAYALKREGDDYKGMRECGNRLERGIELSFPQALAARPVGERAALMALMLANARPPERAPQLSRVNKGGTEALGPISSCRVSPF